MAFTLIMLHKIHSPSLSIRLCGKFQILLQNGAVDTEVIQNECQHQEMKKNLVLHLSAYFPLLTSALLGRGIGHGFGEFLKKVCFYVCRR